MDEAGGGSSGVVAAIKGGGGDGEDVDGVSTSSGGLISKRGGRGVLTVGTVAGVAAVMRRWWPYGQQLWEEKKGKCNESGTSTFSDRFRDVRSNFSATF